MDLIFRVFLISLILEAIFGHILEDMMMLQFPLNLSQKYLLNYDLPLLD